MLRKETVSINGGVESLLQMLRTLMMRPTADVSIFYCAPQDSSVGGAETSETSGLSSF